MAKITYTDKVTMNENADIPAINKCQAADMNEIKSVVNENDTNVGTLSNLQTPVITSIVDAINSLLPVVLYNNDAGSNDTITLSDSAANYSYLEIFYRSNDNMYQSVKVYNPNGKNVSLFSTTTNYANLRIYGKTKEVTISDNKITLYLQNCSQFTINNASTGYVNNDNHIYITRVLGYK